MCNQLLVKLTEAPGSAASLTYSSDYVWLHNTFLANVTIFGALQ